MRSILLILILVWLSAATILWAEGTTTPPAPAQPSKTATTKAEEELGKETAKQIEKDFKLVKDEKKLAKLNALAAEIAPFTQRPDVVYTCKIIDAQEINAMAIPGGIIYFTSGLLNAVESDDELAGVMAHEIAHNAMRHIDKLRDKEKKFYLPEILGILTGIILNGSNSEVSPFQIAYVGEMVKQSLLNGYSKEVENEADANSVQYLAKSKKYDPVGLYSVILGFRHMEGGLLKENRPHYLQNHPEHTERLNNIKKQLTTLRLPKNLWRVVNFRAAVVPPKDGEKGYLIKLGSADLVTLFAAEGETGAEARAKAAVEAINQQLTQQVDGLKFYDAHIDVAADGTKATVSLRKTPVLMLLPGDIDPAGNLTLATLAGQVQSNFERAVRSEQFKRGWLPAD